MKKIFSIITIITALFLILSCGANLHNADVMHVDKVVLEGLTDLVGKEMVISGNWIPNKDGTGFWEHGLGDTSNILDGAIATVDGDGTVVFNIDVITSEAELEFLGKVNEAGWSDAKRFGGKAYAENPNAKIANLFTGSATPKIIFGRVGAGNAIAWSIVDEIPAPVVSTSVFISGVELANVYGVTIDAAAANDVYFLNEWLPGNEWGATTPNCADLVPDGTTSDARRTFAAPVEISDNSIAVQIRMMVDASNFWDGVGNKPNNSASVSIANPKDGNTYIFSYDFSQNEVNLIAVP